jgi:hypothetical protein
MNISSRYGAVLDFSPASLIASGLATSSVGTVDATVGAPLGDEAARVPAPQTPTAARAASDATRVREEGITH